MSFSATTTTTTTPSVAAATAALTRAKAASEGSPTWDELLGSKNWNGLIEPELNLSLREFILRCGNFCQATYDAFNATAESPNCGNSNYCKTNFFHDVLLKDASHYQIVSFLYATAGVAKEKSLLVHSRSPHPWDQESNWFGYVAVTTDKVSRALGHREVYVAWRGTVMQEEWMSNILGAVPVPVTPLLAQCSTGFKWGRQEPKVHDGWLKIYTSQNSHSPYVKTSAREQLHAAIQAIKTRYAGEKLSVVVLGHSLGGALATLSGFDLAENSVAGSAEEVRIAVVGFGCPEVGSPGFKQHVEELPNLKILHVTNIHDRVPSLPDAILTFYVPIDTAELEIDSRSSPYLKRKLSLAQTLVDSHNLEANLHVVAGWSGKGKPFEMRVKRSLALVNKAGDILKSEFNVPASWWGERNKGMEYDKANDQWVFDPPPPADQLVSISFAW